MKCPKCGGAELKHEARDVEHVYKGHKTTLRNITGQHCPACGEIVLDWDESAMYGRQMMAFNRSVHADFMAACTDGFSLPSYAVKPGYQLRSSPDRMQFCLSYAGEPVYQVKVTPSAYAIPGVENGVHVEVWREIDPDHDDALYGFAQDFINWIVEDRAVIVQDDAPTRDTKRFWQYRLSYAVSPRINSQQLYTMDSHAALPVLVVDQTDLVTRCEPDFWYDFEAAFSPRLFIITSKPLRASQTPNDY